MNSLVCTNLFLAKTSEWILVLSFDKEGGDFFARSDEIMGPDGEIMKSIEKDGSYKCRGIFVADQMKHKKMIDR